jgi:hypothetical protein
MLVSLTQMEELAYQFTPALCVVFGGPGIIFIAGGLSRLPENMGSAYPIDP